MANTKDFFLSIIQRVFSNWTALKMSVEHGMGTNERARNFCLYVMEVLFMNEHLDSSALATELEDYMEAEFNTELQDNSAIQVAEELLRFRRYCAEGNNDIVMSEFEKLPSVQPWIKTGLPKPTRMLSPENDDSSASNEEGDDEMESTGSEWTEVRRKRR